MVELYRFFQIKHFINIFIKSVPGGGGAVGFGALGPITSSRTLK